MKPTTAVIGLGIFGSEVALSLTSRGIPVIVIDCDKDTVEPLKDRVAHALILDSTDEHALLDAGVDRIPTVVNAIGTDHLQNSILTTALLSRIGVRHIIARAASPLHERILTQIGAHEVVNPERDMGRRVAQHIAVPHFNEVLHLPDNVSIAEIDVPKPFFNRTLAELSVRAAYNLNVIAVKRIPMAPGEIAATHGVEPDGPADGNPERRMILNLSPTQDRFIAGDVLVVIGRDEDINRFAQRLAKPHQS